MDQKGFAPILILVGVVLTALIASGVYYFGTRKPTTVVPVPTPVVIPQTPQPTVIFQTSRPFPSTTTPQPSQINLDEQNNNQQVSLGVNTLVRITLINRGDAGYQFNEPKYNNQILEKTRYQHIPPSSERSGDFGKDQWTFKAIKQGSSNILFEIFRPWEQTQKEKIFEINVNVKI